MNSSNIGTELLARRDTTTATSSEQRSEGRVCEPWDHCETMAMVPRLPEELLALILEKIALPRYDTFGLKERRDGLRSSIAALRNASLASKTMYRLARPILYG